jgi:hypothetical protein
MLCRDYGSSVCPPWIWKHATRRKHFVNAGNKLRTELHHKNARFMLLIELKGKGSSRSHAFRNMTCDMNEIQRLSKNRWRDEVLSGLNKLKVRNCTCLVKDRRAWYELVQKTKNHKSL